MADEASPPPPAPDTDAHRGPPPPDRPAAAEPRPTAEAQTSAAVRPRAARPSRVRAFLFGPTGEATLPGIIAVLTGVSAAIGIVFGVVKRVDTMLHGDRAAYSSLVARIRKEQDVQTQVDLIDTLETFVTKGRVSEFGVKALGDLANFVHGRRAIPTRAAIRDATDPCVRSPHPGDPHAGIVRALKAIGQVTGQVPDSVLAARHPTALGSTDLRGVVLDGAILRHAVLSRSCLVGASLKGADLTAALLDAATLDGAFLHNATLDRTQFGSSARLRAAHLPLVKADGADLTGADLTLAVLNGAELRGVVLTGARLICAKLVGATLDSVTWVHARVQWTTMKDAGVERAVGWERIVAADDTQVSGVTGLSPPEIDAIVRKGAVRDSLTVAQWANRYRPIAARRIPACDSM